MPVTWKIVAADGPECASNSREQDGKAPLDAGCCAAWIGGLEDRRGLLSCAQDPRRPLGARAGRVAPGGLRHVLPRSGPLPDRQTAAGEQPARPGAKRAE